MQDQLRHLHEPLSEEIAFLVHTGINLVHVPYHVPDLLSGQVQVVSGTIRSCIQYIRGGMLRALN
jgi:hypothetical protein